MTNEIKFQKPKPETTDVKPDIQYTRSYTLMLHSKELNQFVSIEVSFPCNCIPEFNDVLAAIYHRVLAEYPDLKGYTLVGLNLIGVSAT